MFDLPEALNNSYVLFENLEIFNIPFAIQEPEFDSLITTAALTICAIYLMKLIVTNFRVKTNVVEEEFDEVNIATSFEPAFDGNFTSSFDDPMPSAGSSNPPMASAASFSFGQNLPFEPPVDPPLRSQHNLDDSIAELLQDMLKSLKIGETTFQALMKGLTAEIKNITAKQQQNPHSASLPEIRLAGNSAVSLLLDLVAVVSAASQSQSANLGGSLRSLDSHTGMFFGATLERSAQTDSIYLRIYPADIRNSLRKSVEQMKSNVKNGHIVIFPMMKLHVTDDIRKTAIRKWKPKKNVYKTINFNTGFVRMSKSAAHSFSDQSNEVVRLYETILLDVGYTIMSAFAVATDRQIDAVLTKKNS